MSKARPIAYTGLVEDTPVVEVVYTCLSSAYPVISAPERETEQEQALKALNWLKAPWFLVSRVTMQNTHLGPVA